MDRHQFEGTVRSVLDQLGLQLPSDQINSLYRHYTLLQQWNRHINLTSIRDPNEIVFRHFGESLAVGRLIGSGPGAVLDIGSGAGFPGVPVAVMCPERQITLVESVGKKGIFLKEIAREHSNVSVFVGRLEEFTGRAEWATMRGVAAGEVAAQIRRVAERVAVVASAEKISQVTGELGIAEAKEVLLPWDPRTAIVAGTVG